MKLRVATLALTVHYLPKLATAQTCSHLTGSFTLSDITGACTYETLLEEYTRQVFDVAGSTCTASTFTAKEDLDAKLTAATSASTGEEAAVVVCKAMYDTDVQTPFNKAANKGTTDDDLHFEQMFYNGLSDWQEEIETVYESDDLNTATSVLKEDAAKVKEFYKGDGSYSRVEWPDITNFKAETCESHAAMCCWPKDRQANDGNGNCATPYDVNCVDKDPADNTNLCFADLDKGNLSSGFESADGFMVFPGDNGNGEGAIHCHGFAWADDEYDTISRYKANNLFFVSMYDHMHQRGYVKNIPGMPMCGCMEQMPMATRSDCTQVDLTEDWRMEFDPATGFTGVLEKVEVDFNACQGRGGRNNDLWAYAARLYDDNRMTRHQFGMVGRVLTNDHDCYHAVENAKAEKGLITSYTHDENKWTLVAGRDNMKDGEPWQREAFNAAFFDQSLDGVSVMMRICPDCADTHKRVFYRRKTGRPTNTDFDILHNILYGGENADNKWGPDGDFSLHSTYVDAVSGANPWLCPNNAFNYGAPFVGNCSPDGTQVNHQYTKFNSYPGPRRHVAYYVNSPQNSGIQDYIDNDSLADTRATIGVTDMDIGTIGTGLEGNTLENDGVYHVTGAGEDIWDKSDEFHYKSQPWEGDIDVSVHLSSFSNTGGNTWAKMGLMLRSDNSPDATHAFNMLNGGGSVCAQHRRSKSNTSGSSGDCYSDSLKNAWLRIVKKGATVEFYRADGTLDTTPEEWVLQTTDSFFFPEDKYRVGLAVTSNNRHTITEATFEKYSIIEYVFPTSAPSLSSAPTPWMPLVDINTQRAGEFNGDDSSGFTVKGSGDGIWGTADSFMFYNTQVINSTFSSVEMKIDSFGSGNLYSRGGLMIRDTNDEGAANVFVGAGGSSTGATFLSRDVAGANTVHHKAVYVPGNNMWVKLTKSGDVVTAYYKIDAGDEYIEMGSVTLQGLNGSTLQVGRAVSAGTDYQYALDTMTGSSYSIVEV